ncbi:RNA ligase family protein [Bacteroides sp.]|uniref:RNA ligase family protein n=1 Tax=Bacteroides sp. TaxID=29523 RepID=UPI00262F57D7|nr:RNA ligase family protein [Bacteroides sp.]MDD3039032.1 RNA ligase family protein [Bacteroides sp.]
MPGSRIGQSDYRIDPGSGRILTEKTRDARDLIIVTEKLDGSNVAVCKVNDTVIPINRAGYPAHSSHHEVHHQFARWVYNRYEDFHSILREGEQISGEWLGMAHGIRYDFYGSREPFVAFDLFNSEKKRYTYSELVNRINFIGVPVVPILWKKHQACSIEDALDLLGRYGQYGAQEPAEGCVWRVERDKKCEFLAKFVRDDMVCGKYLPSVTGQPPVWNYYVGAPKSPEIY